MAVWQLAGFARFRNGDGCVCWWRLAYLWWRVLCVSAGVMNKTQRMVRLCSVENVAPDEVDELEETEESMSRRFGMRASTGKSVVYPYPP